MSISSLITWGDFFSFSVNFCSYNLECSLTHYVLRSNSSVPLDKRMLTAFISQNPGVFVGLLSCFSSLLTTLAKLRPKHDRPLVAGNLSYRDHSEVALPLQKRS